MQTRQFSLPEWEMVGGESQKRLFTLCDSTGLEYDVAGGSANFAIVDYVNRFGEPYLTKPINIIQSDTGVFSVLEVTLSPSETINLSGKYIYQLSISDSSGNIAIPKHGIIYILNNIDKKFVGGVIS